MRASQDNAHLAKPEETKLMAIGQMANFGCLSRQCIIADTDEKKEIARANTPQANMTPSIIQPPPRPVVR